MQLIIYNYYRLSLIFFSVTISLMTILPLITVLDCALKILYQDDLKQAVAYLTLIHSNIVTFCFTYNSTIFIHSGVLLLIAYTFLSIILFFVVDFIIERVQTREIYEITSLLYICPKLGLFLLLITLLFLGLPGTLLFVGEITFFEYYINN